MNLTPDEQWSVDHASNDHGIAVRMLYFEMKRCPDCNPHGKVEFRSCGPHMFQMAELSRANDRHP